MHNECGLIGSLAVGFIVQFAAMDKACGAYLDGAEGIMAGSLPPPGQYFENYSMYYRADESINFGYGVANIKLRECADLVRFVNVTDTEILGGNWAQQIFVPFLRAEVSSDSRFIVPLRKTDTGLGNVIVDPFLVGWHRAPFHWLVGVDTYVPYYSNARTSSLTDMSDNYWTFEPFAGVTYRNEGGQELSAKLMYDFNTRCVDMDYTPGQAFHADYVAAQHFGPWTTGIGGYWYCQTTSDWRDDSPLARQVALGPQVGYEYCALTFSLAWDHELNGQNRMQGDRVWLKVIIPL